MEVLKLIAALLDYPTELTRALIGEILSPQPPRCVQTLKKAHQTLLRDFAATYKSQPLTQWQEEYVQMFDCSPSASLNLFEHIHGSSRERGGAMADLIDLYRASGLCMANRELPDHLPVFLEYLSTLPAPEAQTHLRQIRPILESLQTTLRKGRSPYSSLLTIIPLSLSPSNH